MRVETRAVIGARNNEHGALVPPLHLSSTFEVLPGESDAEFMYQRVSNPTRSTFEALLASLDGAAHAHAFSTGMAATAAAFSLVRHGDEVLVLASVYGGTYRYAEKVLASHGVTVRFVTDPAELDDSWFTERTAMVFIETPTNPTLRVVDICACARLAHSHGALLVVDNTFMTSLVQDPLACGADVVVQSATKFLGGHSDLLAGVVTTNSGDLAEAFRETQKNYGGVVEPSVALRLIQSVKTLPLRLREQQKNTRALLDFLSGHPAVGRLFYPGWFSEEERRIHESQASGLGAVFTLELAPGYDWRVFGSSLAIAPFAVSLGDVSTLLVHPASTTHEDMSEDALAAAGITASLIRVSVGIEHIDDLVADFDQALARARVKE